MPHGSARPAASPPPPAASDVLTPSLSLSLSLSVSLSVCPPPPRLSPSPPPFLPRPCLSSCDKMVFVQKFMMRKKSDTGARAIQTRQRVSLATHRLSLVCARAAIFTPELNKKCQEIIKML